MENGVSEEAVKWNQCLVDVCPSPLHLAAKRGLKRAVQELLSRGANVQKMDDKGRSAAWSPPPSAVSITVSPQLLLDFIFFKYFMCCFSFHYIAPRDRPFFIFSVLTIARSVVWLRALMERCFVLCFAYPAPATRWALYASLPPFLLSALTFSTSGLTPALACAPSAEVAGCLALILASMMPFCSPCSSGAPSPDSLLRQLQHQLGRGPGGGSRRQRSPGDAFGPSGEEAAANDSEDSETFWAHRIAPSTLLPPDSF